VTLIGTLNKLTNRKTINVVMPPAVGFPVEAAQEIFERRGELVAEQINIYTMHIPHDFARWMADNKNDTIKVISTFGKADSTYDVQFMDMARHILMAKPVAVIAQCTTPFKVSWSSPVTRSLGMNSDFTWDVIQAGVPVIAVENSNMPRVNGNWFTEDKVVDVLYTDRPLHVETERPTTPTDRIVAQHILSKLPAKFTAQLGKGGLANEVIRIAGERINEYWGELITDAAMKLTNASEITATLGFGTPEFYKWCDNNPRVWMLPARITNSLIELQNHKVVSINQTRRITTRGGTSIPYGISGKGGGGETTYGAWMSFVASCSSKPVVSDFVPEGEMPLHDPTKRPRYLVNRNGIVETWPHWDGEEFFDGTPEAIKEAVEAVL